MQPLFTKLKLSFRIVTKQYGLTRSILLFQSKLNANRRDSSISITYIPANMRLVICVIFLTSGFGRAHIEPKTGGGGAPPRPPPPPPAHRIFTAHLLLVFEKFRKNSY
jgi:hypothetical protein